MANSLMEMAYEEFKERTRQIEQSFAEIDAQFKKWKEEVLKFEHSQFGSDDDSCDDDRVCNGESLRASENEDDIQQSSEQTDGQS